MRTVAILAASACAIHATSYTCVPPPETPLCQFPSKIRLTFIGTVIGTNYDPKNPGTLDWYNTWYRVRVEEAFTGLRPDEMELQLLLSLGGGALELGRRFFIHAERGERGISLVSCGITRPADQATAEIQYLRDRLQGRFKPFIAGSVLRHYRGSQYAVEDRLDGDYHVIPRATVVLDGPNGPVSLQTDQEGRFRLNNASPGDYAMTVDFPGYQLPKPIKINVPANGCGTGHAGMFTSAAISGVVRRPDGKPASGVVVDLIDTDPAFRPLTHSSDFRKTGPNGEFSLSNLPSGRFFLGVNINQSTRYPDQTPPVFYPGVATRGLARPIELQPNEHKKNLVLTLLPDRPFRQVRVHIRWPDGTTPQRGAIDAYVNTGIYLSSYELKNGAFELQLLKGVDYWLTPAALDLTRKPPSRFAAGSWLYADNYRLAAGDDDVDITVNAVFDDPQWPKAIYPALKPPPNPTQNSPILSAYKESMMQSSCSPTVATCSVR